MADQAALQEAIQRARQLAAKATQNAPVKRPASELNDHGPIKVTLAYEKPANADGNRERRSSSRDHRDDNYSRSSHRSKERDRDRDREQDREKRNPEPRHETVCHDAEGTPYTLPDVDYQRLSRSNSGQTRAAWNKTGIVNYAPDEKIEIIIPHAVIGLVIGKGGENIKRIQNESGATVRVDPNTIDEKGNKLCTITGTKLAVQEAHMMVSSVIETSASNKRPRTQVDGADQYRMKIPASRTGAIIGKGGETIKSIKQQSGCDIELDKGAKECGPDESVFIIRGTQDKIQKAKALIETRLASRGRDSDSSHGHRSSTKSGVATGANAAPVAQYTDLPATYPAVGQQNSDVNAAWAAYCAQLQLYSTGAAQIGSTGMSYAGSQSLLGSTTSATLQMPQAEQQPPPPPQQQQQPTQKQDTTNQAGQQQVDYSDQWIEFYLKSGRPDYAEQIIELRKQAQQQQQQSQPPQ